MICENISVITKNVKLPGYTGFITNETEERRKKK
jgi:hypothetical protein